MNVDILRNVILNVEGIAEVLLDVDTDDQCYYKITGINYEQELYGEGKIHNSPSPRLILTAERILTVEADDNVDEPEEEESEPKADWDKIEAKPQPPMVSQILTKGF